MSSFLSPGVNPYLRLVVSIKSGRKVEDRVASGNSSRDFVTFGRITEGCVVLFRLMLVIVDVSLLVSEEVRDILSEVRYVFLGVRYVLSCVLAEVLLACLRVVVSIVVSLSVSIVVSTIISTVVSICGMTVVLS